MRNPLFATPEIGDSVVIGYTYVDSSEKVLRQEQHVGTISTINDSFVMVNLTTGRTMKLIPDCFYYAPGGEYTCRSSGEKITNPILLVSWIITEQHEESKTYLDFKPNMAPLFFSKVPKEFNIRYRPNFEIIEKLIKSKGEFYIGKTIIIGMHSRSKAEEYARQSEAHGKIIRVDNKGITVSLDDGNEFLLPPDLTFLQPVFPGEFRERSTGKIVVNPDLMTDVTIEK